MSSLCSLGSGARGRGLGEGAALRAGNPDASTSAWLLPRELLLGLALDVLLGVIEVAIGGIV